MSIQPWCDSDVVALVNWAGIASQKAIRAGRYDDVIIIHEGVAAVIHIGNMCLPRDQPANRWLALKLMEVRTLLPYDAEAESAPCERDLLKPLLLLRQFVGGLPDAFTIGQQISIPEPFDDRGIFL